MRTAVVLASCAKVLRLHMLGQMQGTNSGELDLSNDCEKPVRIIAVNYDGLVRKGSVANVQCRKCPACLNRRRRMWAARAACEISLAKRTWFVTLTASPATMAAWCKRIGLDYTPGIGRDLTAAQYGRLAKLAYRDVQLWKKRLARDYRGLRFLFTVERHTGKRHKTDAWVRSGMGDYYGLPHFHAFVHETGDRCPYVNFKRAARSIGFFKAKLVDPLDMKTVWYVVKYLTKDHGLKIWPSFRYGRPIDLGGVAISDPNE